MELPVLLHNNFFAVLIFSMSACTAMPDRISEADKELTKVRGTYFYQGEPYTGVLETYGKFQTLESEITLVEGVREGISKFYWPDGTLKREAAYRRGVYHGSVKNYFEDGRLFSWFNYKNGQESGKQQMWKSDGRIKVNYEVINGRKYGLTGVKNCVSVLEENSHTF